MKRLFLIASLILFNSFATAQYTSDGDVEEIKQVLQDQQTAWNNYDLEGFMQGYWKSDELKFYGSNGIVRGWN